MAISVTEDYVRVYRAWNNKEHQVYFPLKKNGRYLAEEELLELLEAAEAKDLELAQRQRAHFMRKDLSVERMIHTDGKIVGLKERIRHRKGRKPAHVFEIRVNSEELSKPKFRTVSIDRHGYPDAFAKAIDIICEERGLDPRSPVKKLMLENLSLYQQSSPKLTDNPTSPIAPTTDAQPNLIDQSDISEFEKMLLEQVKAFDDKKKVIKG